MVLGLEYLRALPLVFNAGACVLCVPCLVGGARLFSMGVLSVGWYLG